MSCVAAISVRLSPEDLARANAQRFAYSSPAPRQSLVYRLYDLANSKKVKLRESAALSYNLPYDLQADLALDTATSVRICLARNDHIEPETAVLLSHDKHTTVRGFVALNKALPLPDLERLMEDESAVVRGLAEWRHSAVVDAAASRD